MTASLDVFLCGPARQTQTESLSSAALNVIAAEEIELSLATGTVLSAPLERSTADCVAFVDASRCASPQALAEAAARWADASQAAAALVCVGRENPFSQAWRQLPARLACFLCPPEEVGAVVLRKSKLHCRKYCCC
jgi:hypothetical protein